MENDKILKIIESSHFNFLIGSGASRNYLDTLSNIEELLTSLDSDNHKSEAWYKILNTSIKYWYFDKCIKNNLRLIYPNHPLHKKKELEFKETNQNYSNFLQALNVLLLKRRNKLLPKEVNLFTTNMDLFLDINLDNLGLEFNDGFSGKFTQTFNTSNYQKSFYKNSSQYNNSSELPLFNLFKLHGSLTWDKSQLNEIRYDPRLLVLQELEKIKFPKNYLIPLIKEVEIDGEKKAISKTYPELQTDAEIVDLTSGEDQNLDIFIKSYDKLVMINPTKEKFENTTLRLEYYEQMRMYSNILERENSVLFATGFSFADEHIRQITYRALNSNPTLLIIVFNHSNESKTSVESLFPKLKYKNLYTEYVGFDFKRVADEIFFKLAEQFDDMISTEESMESSAKDKSTESKRKEDADSKQTDK